MKRFTLFAALVFLSGAAGAAEKAAAPSPFQRSAALFQSKCAKCHTVGRGDRVGPDLKGVTERRTREWLSGFIRKPADYLDKDPEAKKLLEKFNGVRMDVPGLSSADADGLIDYLETASAGGAAGGTEESALAEDAPEERITLPEEGRRLWVPGLAGAFLLAAGAALAWRTAGGGPAAFLAVAALGSLYWSAGGRARHHLLGDQQGYEPAQPVAFSHKTHAGTLGVACLYCHHGAEKSDVAGVPSTNICMNCHGAVRKAAGQAGPSPEIAKVVAAWERRADPKGPRLEWVRIHSLPGFVHFSHRVHVNNEVRCQECHGPVQTMERMRQASSLSMGWCVNCHRLAPGAAPTHWKRAGGPLDCAACHW